MSARPDGCVLVVDDDPDVRQMLAFALRACGHEVATAADGRDALGHLAAGLRPAVILLDLTMPGMNGEEFLRARRGDAAAAAVPVLVLSGGVGLPREIEALGVDGYLRKPVGLDALAEALRRFQSPAHGTA